MVSLPVVERLDVTGYGLYPGDPSAPEAGLHVDFQPGLTVVLGTNGLGKTTLVSIIFRLLTGTHDIPGIADRSELGNLKLEAVELRPKAKSTFAGRVRDNAAAAKGHLRFTLGAVSIVVERRLRDMALTRLEIDGEAIAPTEQAYQDNITKLVGLWAFGDWILLLRHLTFYFEDRRALVWDPSAQRQIFRALLLSPDTAREWSEEERKILEADSRVRNINSVLGTLEKQIGRVETATDFVADVREELKSLLHQQRIDGDRVEALDTALVDLDAEREAARQRFMQLEQEREGRFREVERARLIAISARFPTSSQTARYLLAQLMSDSACLVCGHDAPQAAAEYSRRMDDNRCLVCESALETSDEVVAAPDLADARVASAIEKLAAVDIELAAAQVRASDASRVYDDQSRAIGVLRSEIVQRAARIESLRRQLPSGEADLDEQRSELATWRARLRQEKDDLNGRRTLFADFVRTVSRDIAARADAIKNTFDDLARDFLFEDCRLTFSTFRARVGESGELIEFPAFGLEMTGADFTTPVRRQGPDQVSESQREFVDLAFRMALTAVAGTEGAGTLIIDDPESSLDAVFAPRAAKVLSRFATSNGQNRLIVTSNLTDSSLVPRLLAGLPQGTDAASRIVDLFNIAAPTAAFRDFKREYLDVRDRLTSSLRQQEPSGE